jgi:hypothetical protein
MPFDPEAVRAAFISDSASYLGLRRMEADRLRHTRRAAHPPSVPLPHRSDRPEPLGLAVAWQRTRDRAP